MSKNVRPGKSVRVFIADSSALECQLMVWALQQSGKPIRVVGCATDSVEIPGGLSKNSPDVAIISADLRDGRNLGIQATREIRVSHPHVHIIVLVDSPKRTMVVEGFRAGADGVFTRLEPFEMLCKCIHAVYEGQVWAGSEELRFIIEAMDQREKPPIKSASGTRLLTKREEELVQLVAEGLTNRDISRQLGLTEHTVRNYLFRIFNKLGTSNRLELALYVIKQRGTEQPSDFGRFVLSGHVPRSSNGRSTIQSQEPAPRSSLEEGLLLPRVALKQAGPR
jgi:DNA-binding NarL/FixJ family response regulator